MERYIAFDVETPNAASDRMSAIGIAVVEGDSVVDTYTSLINPETHFDWFNIRLTGITPEMVKDAPTFPELWTEIAPIMRSGILIAHNASFDMRVLAGCLADYGIPAGRYARYACTVQMGRRCYPELPNHRLDTLCQFRRIGLDHHRADSDSRACAELLLDYQRHGLDPMKYLRTYDLQTKRTVKKKM